MGFAGQVLYEQASAMVFMEFEWDEWDNNASEDSPDELLDKPLSSDQLRLLLADSEREKLVKKQGEANQQNCFLKHQMMVNEETLVSFKTELAVMELETQALVCVNLFGFLAAVFSLFASCLRLLSWPLVEHACCLGIKIGKLAMARLLTAYNSLRPFDKPVHSKEVLNVETGLTYNPTSSMFINIPCISKLQRHPFSVTSSSNLEANRISVIIKSEGHWTTKFLQLASPPPTAHFKVSVEGLFGPLPSDFMRS